MALRVYIVAADSDRQLTPTFRHIPPGTRAAVEIIDLDAFRRLDADQVRAIGDEFEQIIRGRRS